MGNPNNPEHNHVTFHLTVDGNEKTLEGVGPARATDCIEAIWRVVSREPWARSEDVHQIYSEWEPAPEDLKYLDETFPESAQLGYTFARPKHGQWAPALAAAAKVIEGSTDGDA